MDKLVIEQGGNGHRWVVLPYEQLFGTIADLSDVFEQIAQANEDGMRLTGLRLKLPPETGEGFWTVIQTSAFMYVMTASVTYKKDAIIPVSEDRMIKARVLLRGRLKQLDSGVHLEGAGAFLEAFPGNVASDYLIPAGEQTDLVILNAFPSVLTDTLKLAPDEVPHPLSHVFEKPGSPALGGAARLGPDIVRAASDVFHGRRMYGHDLLAPYLDAKAQEMFCSILHDLGREDKSAETNLNASVRDIRRMSEAREILIQQFRSPPTIPSLARQVGVNQTKLKALFKATYGQTIHAFVQLQRMERALELLSETDLSVSQIGYEVGYEYPASFTHAFSKEFGYSPRQARRAANKHVT
ncbi:MAG: AraC family transcriptional regulator [Pseudomonadota bacterium]